MLNRDESLLAGTGRVFGFLLQNLLQVLGHEVPALGFRACDCVVDLSYGKLIGLEQSFVFAVMPIRKLAIKTLLFTIQDCICRGGGNVIQPSSCRS